MKKETLRIIILGIVGFIAIFGISAGVAIRAEEGDLSRLSLFADLIFGFATLVM